MFWIKVGVLIFILGEFISFVFCLYFFFLTKKKQHTKKKPKQQNRA